MWPHIERVQWVVQDERGDHRTKRRREERKKTTLNLKVEQRDGLLARGPRASVKLC